jgi:hypothetical protein
MALVTAYLARTAQFGSAPRPAAVVRGAFDRIAAFFRATGQAWSEARALEREMMRKYPFLDV